MQIDHLKDSPVGQVVPISGHDQDGREFSHYAYLPHALPSSVELSSETWLAVTTAAEALGRFDEACRSLPNPRLLIAPALAREAVETSALEGTHGAVAEVLEARISAPKRPEVAEIRAYETIAHHAFDWVQQDRPVTSGLLCDLQKELAQESVDPPRDPGKVREHQVVIGPKGGSIYDARFIPPPPDDRLKSGVADLLSWLEADSTIPPIVRAAMAHYQFETLHPFGDGNGRIGRLLISLHLLRMGKLSQPSLTLSPWLRRRRNAYQDGLLHVSQSGAWDPWVTFFSQAVTAQSLSGAAVVNELATWHKEQRATIAERHWSGTAATLLEDLIDWPMVSARWIQDKYQVSAPTAKSTIDRLVEVGILVDMTPPKSRRRLYGAESVMRTVEKL